ncbi:hypothetical protein BGZ59_002282, partial [Podila verticillata]
RTPSHTLALFLFRNSLQDETGIVLENEAHLIETAFGRIKLFRGAARTVIDEPFILKAIQAYFQEKDPVIFAAAAERVLYSTNSSEFMETHIKDESKHRIQDIPPFNIPTPHISGPDIVFYVQINGNFHPCFEQLKIRQFLEGSDVEKVLAT